MIFLEHWYSDILSKEDAFCTATMVRAKVLRQNLLDTFKEQEGPCDWSRGEF
jgi:hypothetical protein